MSITNLTPSQLRRAAEIKEKIDGLELELAGLLGSAPVSVLKVAGSAKKPKFGPAAIARIRAGQKARWAKYKAALGASATEKPARKKRKISPEGLARIRAGQKARWAKVKAAQGN
jgi:hypothetical protein